MKYVISDLGEVNTGGPYHVDIARDFKGKVVRAGHCRRRLDGSFEIWGGSIGFDINARLEDALILKDFYEKKMFATKASD